MSGFVGIIHLKQGVVDRQWLTQMTEFMAYQGPDLQHLLVDRCVGMGCAVLRLGEMQLGETRVNPHNPYALGDRFWAVADLRLDGQQDLLRSLQAEGWQLSSTPSDLELLLYAYKTWGQSCVQHLLGDFSFAIWDWQQQQLFCGRDQFGIKLFYYAHLGDYFLFSNNLNCLRRHPLVSGNLNDQAIADFLLFDVNLDPKTTTFADIQRLPPAHTLRLSLTTATTACRVDCYWSLPTDGCIRYRRAEDYVEQFQTLMQMAVNDRLRTCRAAVLMSGGLDSTTIAAIARDVLANSTTPAPEGNCGLQAHTIICETLIPDQEKVYAGLAAEALGIPIHYLVSDHYGLMEGWDRPDCQRPEPTATFFPALTNDFLKNVATHTRVALAGYGGDPVLLPSSSYALRLLRHGDITSLMVGIWQYFCWNQRLPPLGIRTQFRKLFGKQSQQPMMPYPIWLNPEFAARLNLYDRWQQQQQIRPSAHPIREEAYRNLSSPTLTSVFENYDPSITRQLVEVRYPYFDLRLVNYLLAIPPLPWFIHKQLVRRAMVGVLPDVVRLRPKTPLAGNPVTVLLRQQCLQWLSQISYHTRLREYVDLGLVPPITHTDHGAPWINLRLLSLSNWFSYTDLSNFGEPLCN
jgi:asparagine synthase (glutamine-hydrolysing)